MERPNLETCTDKQFKVWWWKNFNKVCLDCVNNCKQSDKVVVNCNKFKKE